MLSTPLITLTAAGILVGLLVAILWRTWPRGSGGRLSLTEFIELRGRIEAMEQLHGDLADRFTRFQKRENMREGRQIKASDKSLQEEAADILTGQPEGATGGNGPASSRADLYRRAGKLWRK